MLQELNILGDAFQYLWVTLTGIGAGVFLWIYFTNRDSWWAIIPGLTLAGLTLVSLENALGIIPGSDWSGSLFLGFIGLAFILVYLRRREQWWAIIPGGVMITLSLVAGLSFFENSVEVIFFLGLAITFALVGILPNQSHDTRWAFIPAAVLFVMGIALFAPLQAFMQIIWPLALVGVGIYVLVRNLT
jgi:hypothetical protein